jgi:sugar-specific transcriptional regulator TrmB
MESIPTALIKSLIDLGLSNYEARVYSTLVLYDNAEAKEIIDFLSISKPSVYGTCRKETLKTCPVQCDIS